MRLFKDQSGQSMVLGAITLLCVALVTFMSLQVGHVVHEKIRVQNYADERAFSLAVQEARSFNYYAYTNRGIAASYVSMAAMHAYYSEVTMMADSYAAAMMILITQVIPEEIAECCSCPIVGCCKIPHCVHAVEAGITVATSLAPNLSKPAQDVQALDSPFRMTIDALKLHATTLFASQKAMQASVSLVALKSGSLSGVLSNSANGFGIQDSDLVLANAAEYNLAIDTLGNSDRHKKLMAEISNATRPPFVTNRSSDDLVTAAALLIPWIPKIRKAAGNQGLWVINGFQGAAGISNNLSPSSTSVQRGADGKTISSFDWGELSVIGWHDGLGTWPLPFLSAAEPGYVVTGTGWKHSAALENPHSGSAHDDTYRMEDYTEFNISSSAPYNQPSVFAAATLGTDKDVNGNAWPWLLNSSGSVTLDIGGSGGSGTVQLADTTPVAGVSKAMAYYHRFGDWRDTPNFWNPYWRAKLEPMTLAEATGASAILPGGAVTVVSAIGATPEKGAVNIK